MSFFLVYVELGPAVAFVPPAEPLVATAITLVTDRAAGLSRHAWVLTDGLSSERLLRFDAKLAGRAGAALRVALNHFLDRRLNAGARCLLGFVQVDAGLDGMHLPLAHRRTVALSDLANTLQTVQLMDVIEVIR